MHALYIIVPILCILVIAYRYYSAFIAAKVLVARRLAADAGAHALRRPQLLPDARAGCSSATTSRPSPAPDRWSARCWPRSSATRRASSGSSPASCLAGAVHDLIILWASTRRGGRSLAEIARDGDRPGRRRHHRHRDPLHHHHRARRPRPRRRQRAQRERVGHLHDRRDDPAGDVHGLLHVPLPEGPHRGGDDHRRHRPAAARWRSASRSPASASGWMFTLTQQAAGRSRWASTGSSPRCCRSGCCWRRATT